MYIPPFWCGFILGLIAGIILVIAAALIWDKEKKYDETEDIEMDA